MDFLIIIGLVTKINFKNRADFYKVYCDTFMKPIMKEKRYFLRFDVDDRVKSKDVNRKFLNNYKIFNRLNNNQKENYIKSSGLNNLQYKITEDLEINDFIEELKWMYELLDINKY